MTNKEPEWTKYQVGKPSDYPNFIPPDCTPLSEVSHVTHLNAVQNILREGKIHSKLVSESKLNTDRITVCWLSPNHWFYGSRYGTVAFDFNWKEIIKDMKFFWVGVESYNTPACRILITEQDHSSKFDVYDPTLGNGPWWYDKENDTHYRNANFCLEFMLEEDLELEKLKKIDFVKHHDEYCNIKRTNCKEKSFSEEKAQAIFLATVVSRRLPTDLLKLTNKEGIPTDELINYFCSLLKLISDFKCFLYKYEVRMADENKESTLPFLLLSIAKAISNELANTIEECKGEEIEKLDLINLISLFSSEEELSNSCADLVARQFSLSETGREKLFGKETS